MLSDKIFSTHTVDTFATCGFNVRMRKYAQCGPRLSVYSEITLKGSQSARRQLELILAKLKINSTNWINFDSFRKNLEMCQEMSS